jgi:hypothetical protein
MTNTNYPGIAELEIVSQNLPFVQFLEGFKEKLYNVFQIDGDIDELSLKRGLPKEVLHEIMSYNPLSICIPF